MKLYESEDAKGQLLRKSELQRQALGEEAKLISERTQKILTNGLIIGGAFVATYLLIRSFSGSKKRRKGSKKIRYVAAPAPSETVALAEPETPGIVSQLGAALASQATVFLLDLAKEKLSEYLHEQSQKKASV